MEKIYFWNEEKEFYEALRQEEQKRHDRNIAIGAVVFLVLFFVAQIFGGK